MTQPPDARLRERTRFAFLWIALVPMVLAALAVWLSGQFRQEAQWIEHTYEVRAQVRDMVQLSANTADSLGQYFLTGLPEHATAIDAHSAELRQRIAQLGSLTSDDPVQRRNVRTLGELVSEFLAEIEDSRRLAQQGDLRGYFPDKINVRDQQALRKIRDRSRQTLEEEERLMLRHTLHDTRISREVEAIFLAAIVVTLGLLLWAGRRMRAYALQRDRAEDQLQGTVKQIEGLNRELEERVEERTAALSRANENLSRSNEDLERFAFIASHDLQEPLRVVTLYAQLLDKSCRGILDERAVACIAHINEGTQRMLALLTSLLAYAEIGVRAEQAAAPVDLNGVLKTVKQNLAAAIEETDAKVRCAPLPVLKVSEGHFIQLFQNLIENAIKYRGERPPRIDISVRTAGDELVFSVADNGMGIEPQYHERIFVAFKRLHGRGISGTGIGLAICKRALDRYGGRIWVESAAGQGATFHFTVPAALECSAVEMQSSAAS